MALEWWKRGPVQRVLPRTGLVLAALLLGGCADSGTRVYSVTVLEPAEIECEALIDNLAVDEDLVKDAAKQARRFWRKQKELYPPQPEGRELHVIELASSMRAWFEAPIQSSNSTTGQGPSVFAGDVRDNYLEGEYQAVVNTDDEDEEAERQLCGPRVYLSGKLLATLSDGAVLGRLQWQTTDYFGTQNSVCAARVVCSRNVDVWGAEQ